ncbi:type III effector [Kriegella sp. EG-1]|nr:type III effector [Flavobacteriaceae bacterium EG-1]
MNIEDFKNKLKNSPESIEFSDTMAVIDENYSFSPTSFTNGAVKNERGQNSGSCKLFAFALKEKLSKDETLLCFGQFFRDVKKTPDGTDHQNIRNFIKTGFEGLSFDGEALKTM